MAARSGLRIRTDETDQSADGEGHELDVQEGGPVNEGARFGGLDAQTHACDGDEESGERHEAHHADGPGVADLVYEFVEYDGVLGSVSSLVICNSRSR